MKTENIPSDKNEHARWELLELLVFHCKNVTETEVPLRFSSCLFIILSQALFVDVCLSNQFQFKSQEWKIVLNNLLAATPFFSFCKQMLKGSVENYQRVRLIALNLYISLNKLKSKFQDLPDFGDSHPLEQYMIAMELFLLLIVFSHTEYTIDNTHRVTAPPNESLDMFQSSNSGVDPKEVALWTNYFLAFPSAKDLAAESVDFPFCAICLDDIEDSEETSIFSSCSHIFHYSCTDKLMKSARAYDGNR